MSEMIDRWFCACASYPDDPGMVVCWMCEQPVVHHDPDETPDAALVANLLLLGIQAERNLQRVSGRVLRLESIGADKDGVVKVGTLLACLDAELPLSFAALPEPVAHRLAVLMDRGCPRPARRAA